MSVIRSDEHIVGEIAQLQVAEALTWAGCAVKSQIPDYGEDFDVEIPYDGRFYGIFVFLQVKGTRSPHKTTKGKIVLDSIRLETLAKWGGMQCPVALISWNIETRTGYYSYVNGPHDFQCNVKKGNKSRTLFAPNQNFISAKSMEPLTKEGWKIASLLIQATDRSIEATTTSEEEIERIKNRLLPTLEFEGVIEIRGTKCVLSKSGLERFSEMAGLLLRLNPNLSSRELVWGAIRGLILLSFPKTERIDLMPESTIKCFSLILASIIRLDELAEKIEKQLGNHR